MMTGGMGSDSLGAPGATDLASQLTAPSQTASQLLEAFRAQRPQQQATQGATLPAALSPMSGTPNVGMMNGLSSPFPPTGLGATGILAQPGMMTQPGAMGQPAMGVQPGQTGMMAQPGMTTMQPGGTPMSPSQQQYPSTAHLSGLSESTRAMIEQVNSSLPGIQQELDSLLAAAQQQTQAKRGDNPGGINLAGDNGAATGQQTAAQPAPAAPAATPPVVININTGGGGSAPSVTSSVPGAPVTVNQTGGVPSVPTASIPPTPSALMAQPTGQTQPSVAPLVQRLAQLRHQGEQVLTLYESGQLSEAAANQMLSEINQSIMNTARASGITPQQLEAMMRAAEAANPMPGATATPQVAPQMAQPGGVAPVAPQTFQATTTGGVSRRAALLASFGRQVAQQMNSTGWCYKGVAKALDKVGVHVSGQSAYMAADQLSRRPDFQNLTPQWIRPEQLRSIVKPGDVVVYDKGPGKPHGHIAIVQPGGLETSDHTRQLTTNYPSNRVRVFRPMDGAMGSIMA